MEKKQKKMMHLFIAVSIVALLAYIPYDYKAMPDVWVLMALIRVACSALGVFVLLLFRKGKLTYMQGLYLFMIPFYLFIAIVPETAKMSDTSRSLFNMTIAAVAFIWPAVVNLWSGKNQGILSGMYLVTALIALFTVGSGSLLQWLAAGGGGILLFLIVSPFITETRYQLALAAERHLEEKQQLKNEIMELNRQLSAKNLKYQDLADELGRKKSQDGSTEN